MKNLEEVIISVIKGAEEVEAKYKWNGRRYVTSNGMTGKLVRCKECKHCYVDGEQVKFNACELNHNKVQSDDWFCADGEREGE